MTNDTDFTSKLDGQSTLAEVLRDMSERLDKYDIVSDGQIGFEISCVLLEELGEMGRARQEGNKAEFIDETFDALSVMLKIASYLCDWDENEFAERLSTSINKLV